MRQEWKFSKGPKGKQCRPLLLPSSTPHGPVKMHSLSVEFTVIEDLAERNYHDVVSSTLKTGTVKNDKTSPQSSAVGERKLGALQVHLSVWGNTESGDIDDSPYPTTVELNQSWSYDSRRYQQVTVCQVYFTKPHLDKSFISLVTIA